MRPLFDGFSPRRKWQMMNPRVAEKQAKMSISSKRATPSHWPEPLSPVLFLVFFSAAIFVWFFCYCRFGFDYTDEMYYLNWISRPFEYDGLWLGRGEGR